VPFSFWTWGQLLKLLVPSNRYFKLFSVAFHGFNNAWPGYFVQWIEVVDHSLLFKDF
jgi:hypothetical protein